MTRKTSPAPQKGNLKSVTATSKKTAVTKKKAPVAKKAAPAHAKTSSKKAVSKSTKTPAVKKTAAKKLAPVQPTLTAYVEFRSCVTGKYVARTYEVTKADINDVDWHGGDCFDSFFNAFETNEERFQARLEDLIQYRMWQTDDEGQALDPDLNGNHPNGLASQSFVTPSWTSDFEETDFYPV